MVCLPAAEDVLGVVRLDVLGDPFWFGSAVLAEEEELGLGSKVLFTTPSRGGDTPSVTCVASWLEHIALLSPTAGTLTDTASFT